MKGRSGRGRDFTLQYTQMSDWSNVQTHTVPEFTAALDTLRTFGLFASVMLGLALDIRGHSLVQFVPHPADEPQQPAETTLQRRV